MTVRLIVFTDLDGTLLDHDTYDFAPAVPALERLSDLGIPVVPVTSKTRAEMLVLREQIGLDGPFAVENGGAIYVPDESFAGLGPADETGLVEIQLGVPVTRVREALGRIRAREGIDFRGFGEVSDAEVAAWTGLDLEAAARARARTSSEPLRFEGDAAALAKFQRSLEKEGLVAAVGGRFVSVQGPTDKGRALRRLVELYRADGRGMPTSVALGDSDNDLPMLLAADVAVVIPRPPPRAPLRFEHPRRIEMDAAGPAGFCSGIERVLSDHGL